MLEATIPALIAGVFTIISILLGNNLITNSMHSIKNKQELINMLSACERKKELQNIVEVLTHWAVVYGDQFLLCRKMIFWMSTSLALSVIAGSIIIFCYIVLNIQAVTIKSSMVSVQSETLFRLLINHIEFSSFLMLVPIAIGAAGFSLTSLARNRQIKRLTKLKR